MAELDCAEMGPDRAPASEAADEPWDALRQFQRYVAATGRELPPHEFGKALKELVSRVRLVQR
jgi:hypothetical protein